MNSTRPQVASGLLERGPGALAQLRTSGYADSDRARGRNVHLIGVEISAEERDIAAFEAEPA